MKVVLYLDLFPGIDPRYLLAQTSPGAKTSGYTRYAITVNLPDPNEPDVIVSADEVKEVEGV
jgi:hypothetical protein